MVSIKSKKIFGIEWLNFLDILDLNHLAALGDNQLKRLEML